MGYGCIVYTYGAYLGTSAAEAAPVGKLGQPGYGLPVKVDIVAVQSGEQFIFFFNIFVDDAAEDF